MAKQNKSWEDQLSGIYTEMTGVKVDFGKQKSTAKRIASERRKKEKYLEKNGIGNLVNKRKPTNEDRPGYGAREKVCGITIAVLPLDFKINPRRLDAPCEMCINEQCAYSMGRR